MNNDLHFSSQTNEWYTPKSVFEPLNTEFRFTLDPCCTKESAKAKRFYTIEDDGLSKNWYGEKVFVNPPYGREIGKWVKKCHDENMQNGTLCVLLIPARTDTSYWHDYIFGKAEIRFMRGRVKFERPDGTIGDAAPFPTAIVIYKEVNK